MIRGAGDGNGGHPSGDGENGDGPLGDVSDDGLDDEPLEGADEVAAALLAAELTDGTLTDVLDAHAVQQADLTMVVLPGGVEYRLGDRPFARRADASADFRLGREIVAAAMRTPDASASAHGPEWVSFRPRRFDRFASDRAVAWFDLALKRARAG